MQICSSACTFGPYKIPSTSSVSHQSSFTCTVKRTPSAVFVHHRFFPFAPESKSVKMVPKISLALIAIAALLHLSHGIPTHRFARHTKRDIASKIKEYMGQIPGYGSSGSSGSSESSSASSTAAATETSSGSEAAASELQSSIATKEGSSSESGLSSYQNYLPSFGSYPSQLPSQFNPSQYGQYPSQFPSQFNPQQYLGSSGSAASPSAASPAGAASEPQASIAAKEGSSSESGLSSYQNYLPSFGSYPSQLPSQFNPSQYGQYPSQFPSQFNPQQYLGSSGSAASPSAASPAGAASEPQASIAAKEGSSSESGLSSYQNYLPSFGSYPSQLPSQFNPSQYGQYPSQFPSQFNPQQYLGSSGSAASPSAASPAGAASEPQASIAAKEGSSSESGLSSYQNYLPSFGSYPSQLPSQFNPSQYGQYPSQFPSQFNPQQYLGSSGSAASPSAASPAGAASEPQASVAIKEGSSSESGLSSYQNYLPSFGSYPSQLPSQFNPSQYGQYPSQFPSQFNPQQYLGGSSNSAASSSAAQGSSNATP